MKDKIRVSAIQRLCIHDGPGVRTTLFLKGCYLSCPWCCNPETIYYNKDLFFEKNRDICGKSSICNSCEILGGERDKLDCPLGAYVKTYTDYSVDELYELLVADKSIFDTNGGITISGGEPLFQAIELVPLLKKIKDDGIHLAIETSLYGPKENFECIKHFIDYWIIDVKFQFGFISYLEDNKYEADFTSNISWVQTQTSNMKIRMVISHQAIKKANEILARFKKHSISNIELLACHQLAENKYKQLGLNPSHYSAPSDDELSEFINVLSANNIYSNVLSL